MAFIDIQIYRLSIEIYEIYIVLLIVFFVDEVF